MNMKHYDQQEWVHYVKGQLSSDALTEMENHLYNCETCLTLYMTCIEESAVLPLQDVDNTETYMQSILARTVKTRPSWFRSTMFHYGIAAAATLVLVATGFFHGLSQELGSVGTYKPAPPLDAPATLETTVPISDQLVNKTLSWLDTLHKEHNEGGTRP